MKGNFAVLFYDSRGNMIESHANELPERTVNNLAIIDERARVGS